MQDITDIIMQGGEMSDSDVIMGRGHCRPEDLWKRQGPINQSFKK